MQTNLDFDLITAGATVLAVAGYLLLIPLYVSQRRDVQRLRAWRDREPAHPGADLAASEAILDRAEAELARLGAGPPPEPAPAAPAPPATAASRVTGERPALERVTAERAALAPHPRWRRFVGRATQANALVAIALAALLLGAGAIVVTQDLLSGGDEGEGAKGGRVVPSEVTVAVLNGTSVPGLAGKVGDDVEAKGFRLGEITNSEEPAERSLVLYERGHEREARSVGKQIGVDRLEQLDGSSRRLGGGADVVVIAGADRTR